MNATTGLTKPVFRADYHNSELIDWYAAQVSELKDFIREIADQKPEKPDYWSSCSQCEGNSRMAQELLEAAPSAVAFLTCGCRVDGTTLCEFHMKAV